MKRIISCLLAAALVLAPCAQASALGTEIPISENAQEIVGAETANDGQAADQGGKEPDQEDLSAAVSGAENPEQPDLTEEPKENKESSVSADEADAPKETADDAVNEDQALEPRAEEFGQLETVIVAALDVVKPIEFTIKVTGANAQQQEQKVQLGASGAQASPTQVSALFKDLSLQEYTVTVTAAGFAAYTQNIPVNNSMLNRIQIMTGPVSIDDGAHPGIIRIGDVDGSGQIDDADRDKLVDVLDGKPGDGLQTDLNGDGQTDLADLEYFAKGYKEPDVKSTVEAVVPADAVVISQDKVNVVEGNVEDLLTDQGGRVKLSPSNNEAITPENPVEVDFNLDAQKSLPVGGVVIRQDPDNAITQAELEITYEENGAEQHVTVPYNEPQAEEGIHYMLRSAAAQALGATVSKDPVSGDICLDLGAQAPVKKVTIRIKGVKKNNNLAEISKVEFIGNMADRIPEPQKDIPQNVTVVNGSQEFTLNWDPCVNVTGYEVWIALKTAMDKPVVMQVTGNTLRVMSLGDEKIVDGEDYAVKVRAVNGEWRSEYSQEVTASPRANKLPDAPDNLSLTPKYKAIAASWKKMKGTDSYKLYYKKTGEAAYRPAIPVEGTSYTISDLEDRAEYEVCVSGVNGIGEGPKSLVKKTTTIDMNPAKMPKYKRLNEAENGKVSGRIVSASSQQGGMKDSPLDTEGRTIWGTVDNNHESYFRLEDWDMGVNYHPGWGLTYEFDQEYEIQNIAFQSAEAEKTGISKARITYWDGTGAEKAVELSVQSKTDPDGKAYFFMQLPGATMVKKINIGLTTGYARLITVSEVNFYFYDSLEDDIMALYQDDLHTVLRSETTTDEEIQAKIDGLRERLNTKEPVSGEYHPDKVLLEKELQTAQDILDAKDLSKPVKIHRSIITGDVGRGFAGPGLNAWQPLGVTAAAGEKLNVYVGHKDMSTGDNTRLKLVATQYHAESNGVTYYTSPVLKIGRNEINISIPTSTGEAETGGALYVKYEGGSANDDYAVRVDGGTEVPVLDLYKVTDEAEKQKRAEEYVNALTPYVEKMPQTHGECHQVSENQLANVAYDEKNCILGATDILLDTMMLSLPAKQILAGAGSGTPEEKAQNIVKSMDAMEEMMYLFYQHKGLNKNAPAQVDQFPKRHLNIRYQRMFAGAFMYAGGNHIGIEYGSAPGLMGGRSVQTDADGKHVSGQYFGWGIAHEIGHDINQGAYAYAEVTNNYFSVLAQARDTNDSVRFQYKNVYDKVSSGTKGRANNVFTQLGLYWQLHLAYDNGYNYKTYEDYTQQLENLFFARVDTYARTPSKAPAPGGVALALSGDSDQKLMRLACAAAKKDILEFFERWGMTPDAGTIAYAGQFEKETRAIFYASDDARVYRLTHSGSALSTNSLTQAVGNGTAAAVDADNKNKVNITLQAENIPVADILGYEITRCTTANGEVSEQPVGFAWPAADGSSAFTDTVTTMNNRVVTYKVRVIDQYLNRSAAKELNPVKIEHEGEIDKTGWTVSVNNVAAHEEDIVVTPADEEDLPCGPVKEHPIVKTIDNDLSTAFTGTTKSGAEVILEFNQTRTVAAFKYTNKSEKPSIGGYRLSVQEEGQWKDVAEGAFDSAQAQTDKGQTVYFSNGGNVARYEATAVKLSITDAAGGEIGITELDVLGVTGDNVDFRDAEDQPAIGKLKDAYRYEGGEIPADSIVFIGKYKGNPAYNVVMLYDQDGNVIGGKDAEDYMNMDQMIFANVPDEGNIEDVYDGTWVYWIDPKYNTEHLSDVQKVRAELYRVDNAETNEGERMVSDSLFREMPAELPFITISGTGVTGGSVSGNSPSDNSAGQ